MKKVDKNTPDIDELAKKLGRRKSQVAKMAECSLTHVARFFAKDPRVSPKASLRIIAASIAIIDSKDPIVENIKPSIQEPVYMLKREEIKAMIDETVKTYINKNKSERLTRTQCIIEYFGGKQRAYENHMSRHNVKISKGPGRNSEISMSRSEFEATLTANKIAS